jgi:hypothetical protein
MLDLSWSWKEAGRLARGGGKMTGRKDDFSVLTYFYILTATIPLPYFQFDYLQYKCYLSVNLRARWEKMQRCLVGKRCSEVFMDVLDVGLSEMKRDHASVAKGSVGQNGLLGLSRRTYPLCCLR